MTGRDVLLVSSALLVGGAVAMASGAWLCRWAILKVLP